MPFVRPVTGNEGDGGVISPGPVAGSGLAASKRRKQHVRLTMATKTGKAQSTSPRHRGGSRGSPPAHWGWQS